MLCQKQVSRAGTQNYVRQILWDVITCPCPWYQLQVKHSSYVRADTAVLVINTLRPRWSRCHFADDSFRYIFLNENIWIFTKISLKFIAKSPINDIPALVQVMAWCWPAPSHYLKQWWLDYWPIYASFLLNELNLDCWSVSGKCFISYIMSYNYYKSLSSCH